VKLRLPGRRPASDPTPDAAAAVIPHGSTAVGAGKGRPTPKRTEAQGRRSGPVPPPPTTRKEAYKRMREQQASGRGSAREAAARGDDSGLPARDRGPVRRLVRDIVDTRRNVASAFLLLAAVAIVGVVFRNPAVQTYSTLLMLVFFLFVAVDSFFLARRIKRVLADRLPKESTKGAAWYGISRSTMIRKWRFPKPQVAQDAQL